MIDHCCKSKRHPAEVGFDGKSWCMECFDKETEKRFKKQKEIRTIKGMGKKIYYCQICKEPNGHDVEGCCEVCSQCGPGA